ncbi:MAG: hypothetical protein GXY38_06295 [Planctomycetes bacterium]|nr:hypothetical protein [Planctomycetota bacterium]
MTAMRPLIWRSAQSRFNDDEPLNCSAAYTPQTLRSIAEQGFDAIWMRGRLWDLIRSEIYPELNDPLSKKRIESLRGVIADGKEAGVTVFMYFNEPQALRRDHSFWKKHPELAGEPYIESELEQDVLSFCTSTPQFKAFFNESISNLYHDLPGLGGVILITASEYQSHCWSHRTKRPTGDHFLDKCCVGLECPNCRNRQPGDVVAELVGMWKTNADLQPARPQVWAWNWSWSMWYDTPQREVIDKLPPGVLLMCDFERGGLRKQAIGDVAIDEYSLGYAGPSEQFLESLKVARERNTPVSAKLQIGTTHELATVPNIPLIPNLFDKLQRIDELGISGVMCSWNFGNSPSLNTAALKMFMDRPALRRNSEEFRHALAGEYLCARDGQTVVAAWDKFCRSFAEYPFGLKMLYFSPMNYAVSYPLVHEYRDHPMGPSWIGHKPWGDRLEDCMPPFDIDQVCTCFEKMERFWLEGLELYSAGLDDAGNPRQAEELMCAKMIGWHLSAMRNIFEFHRYRRRRMAQLGLHGPCALPVEAESQVLIHRQLRVCQAAMELAKNDSRLGYHQEPGEYFYTPDTIAWAVAQMQPG